jgi:transposase-like protein
MILACIRCEGSGVVRDYLNIAGDYRRWHCPDCGGTGLHEYGAPLLKADADRRDLNDYERQQEAVRAARRANMPRWLRWLLP